MYEQRKKMQDELREKQWFYYAILAIGIFMFSQACSMMKNNFNYAAASVVFGIIMHNVSLDKILMRVFNITSQNKAKIAMLVFLFLIAVLSYFVSFRFIYFLLLDLASIVLFVLLSFIFSKHKKRQE